MPRGTTLAQLRYMLRAETGQTLTVSAATDGDAELNTLLFNKQNWLAAEHFWPFLEHRWDLAVAAGNRFLTLPTTTDSVSDKNSSFAINFDWPVRVECYFNGYWRELDYGIGGEEFDHMNSDGPNLDGVHPDQLDPIQNWRFATNANEPASPNQIEIWPIPATAQTIRFTGQRSLVPLYSSFSGGAFTWDDTATADLDDMLLVYSAAAEILLRRQDPSAQAKQALAQRRLQQVRQHFPQPERKVVLGKNLVMARNKRTVPIVVVR